MKRPNVRSWLGWSEESRGFTNEERLHELYGWIIGELVEDDDEELRSDPKLPEAKSVRILSKFIEDDAAMMIFRSPGGTLTQALAKHESDLPQEWKLPVINAQSTLASLSPDTLREMEVTDIMILNELLDRIKRVLEDREKLLKD
jgi:hypothetical protein